MADYKLGRGNFIIRARDTAIIPIEPNNRDYLEYLTWAERNEPDPMDEEPELSNKEKRLAEFPTFQEFAEAFAGDILSTQLMKDKINALVEKYKDEPIQP